MATCHGAMEGREYDLAFFQVSEELDRIRNIMAKLTE